MDIAVNNLTALAMTTGQMRLESGGSPWRPLEQQISLYVPVGCAHGFRVLTYPAEVSYGIDRSHDPAEDVSLPLMTRAGHLAADFRCGHTVAGPTCLTTNCDDKDADTMANGAHKVYKRDFWIKENLNYAQPHFRLVKSARIVNRIARGKECDLLDVGCGPATLMGLLRKNIHYYGVDIAIQNPAPYLIQADLLETPIKFDDKRFDIVLAQGFFEYVGSFQHQKFTEIKQLLNGNGIFITSYVNFGHRDRNVYWPYSNIQSIDDFRKDLTRYFNIDACFPTSHNWRHHEPNRRFIKASQIHTNVNVPFISPKLAVEYFFICS